MLDEMLDEMLDWWDLFDLAWLSGLGLRFRFRFRLRLRLELWGDVEANVGEKRNNDWF